MWSLSLITPPAAEPLDLQTDVKQQLRLDQAELYAQISIVQGAIAAARQNCETFTGRQLITASWELWLDSWLEDGIYCEGALQIPKGPITPASVVIKYFDTAGVSQTWPAAKYVVIAEAGPTGRRPRIVPAVNESWPSVQARSAAIQIAFTAGYGAAASSIPAGLRNGMLLQVAELYERRELLTVGTIVSPNILTAHAMWSAYRLF